MAFSSFRDTSATHIERIHKELTELLLEHVDKRMARFYVDPEHAHWSRMDEALDALEKMYGLSIED